MSKQTYKPFERSGSQVAYHVSNKEIKKPDLLHNARDKEFGAGFYIFFHKKDAEKFAKENGLHILNMYEYYDLNCEVGGPDPKNSGTIWLEYIIGNLEPAGWLDGVRYDGSLEYEDTDLDIVNGTGINAEFIKKLYDEDKLNEWRMERSLIYCQNINLPHIACIKSQKGLQALTFLKAVDIDADIQINSDLEKIMDRNEETEY